MALPILVYCREYDLHLGAHVFPSEKYALTFAELQRQGAAAPVEAPRAASPEDLTLAHRADWVERLCHCRLSPTELMRLEIPWGPETLQATLLHVGGSILACRRALAEGAAVNLGGGFHHAFPGHGEGFCALNDIAVGIRTLQRERRLARAWVVDCDVHQGNGTAAIFSEDASVFTLSLHQENNYPVPKQRGDLDVNLADGAHDEDYLAALAQALDVACERFRPLPGGADLLWYVAGADPFYDDQLGGLALTREGLRRRDEMVIRRARECGLPLVVTLAGGYARNVADTVAIHVQTVLAAGGR